ncbi:hypothetical protein AB0J83_20965 [Actinoplanes sp. NPDC049596]|uniref:hypothetical protein n=1 Tax=unclassified Actinoplanes TaxID=2626549 RepID=UPI00342B8087
MSQLSGTDFARTVRFSISITGLPRERVATLMTALAANGLVEQNSGRFVLVPAVAEALRDDAAAGLDDMLKGCLRRTGGSPSH